MTETSRYYAILLDGADISEIAANKSKIIDILNVKARRVFARRELGFSDLGDPATSWAKSPIATIPVEDQIGPPTE